MLEPLLQEAADRVRRGREEKAVVALQGLIDTFTGKLKQSVNDLRIIRKREREQNVMVKKLTLAVQYFGETGNPLPVYKVLNQVNLAITWCKSAGIPTPKDDSPFWVVPANYQPKTIEVPDAEPVE